MRTPDERAHLEKQSMKHLDNGSCVRKAYEDAHAWALISYCEPAICAAVHLRGWPL
jgi:hypothetical protein